MNKRKALIFIAIILSFILLFVGVTYAYWVYSKSQTNYNVVGTGCLDISLDNEANDIKLTEQFPISDEAGMKLTPYTFKITNKCNTTVDYHINLESLGDQNSSLKASSIKAALNEFEPKRLSEYGESETTVSGAYESRVLQISSLAAKEELTYNLRIWIDYDAPNSEQNKTFQSKISVSVGQGVFNPYKEGTLAHDILSNYGGANAITNLSDDWVEGTYGSQTYQGMTKTTSYYWGTELNFDKKTGQYTLGGIVVKATVDECRNGQKSDGTRITCLYTLTGTSDAKSSSKTGYKVIALSSSSKEDTSGTAYITIQKTGTASNSFSVSSTANDAGLFKARDDLGESYYYRGNVTNNYVKFGKYVEDFVRYKGYASTSATSAFIEHETLEECTSATSYNVNCTAITYANKGDDMYWRIVRINGDGSIRMIYDGPAAAANGVSHTATIGSTKYNIINETKYIGYTYDDGTGTQVDSTIKSFVDGWYEENLKEKYGRYIADGIFCNDREVISSNNYSTYFAPNERVKVEYKPALTCTNRNDRYTINDTLGNGLLTEPVGLLTLDEAAFAGGGGSDNSTYYLYSGENYWTISPLYFFLGTNNMGYVVSSGRLGNYSVTTDSPHVRPVINLRADVKFTGDGRIDTNSPYEIVIN